VIARPILRAEAIGKRFRQRPVLSSATLWETPGRITALLGRNGAGKSTLLKIAAGWMRADYGVVIFKDERLTRPRLPHLASRGLCYLPERSLLCPTVTLGDHLLAVQQRFSQAALDQVVSRLRLETLLARKSSTLSTGERRRAEIAVAVMRRPDCLLADEPLLGIAPADAELVSQSLRDLAGRGTAVVVSGHEVPRLLELADELVWQTAGTTHFLGTPQEACNNDQFAREYLGAAGLRVVADRRQQPC